MVFSTASGQRRVRQCLLGLVAVVAMLALVAACGGEPEEDAIRLQANAVGGGQIYFEDLGSQDTMLWFWAPW